jgi:hypothetical protein
MSSWCSKCKIIDSGMFYACLWPKIQAADSALLTLDEFTASMHWTTYRASKSCCNEKKLSIALIDL